MSEKGPDFIELLKYFAAVAVCEQIYSQRLSYLEDLVKEILLNISDGDYWLAKMLVTL